MHAHLADTTGSSFPRSVLSTLAFYAAANILFTLATSAHVEAQERSAEPPAPRPEMRLRINWGISDVQYRQQMLAITPIGTSYDDVKTFILNEWHAEKLPIVTPPNWPPGMTLLGGSEFVLQPFFNGYGINLYLRDEPPHIKIMDVRNPFPAHEGRRYINPFFQYKPVWWKRSLYVGVFYVFDDHSRVIDLFAHGGIVMPF